MFVFRFDVLLSKIPKYVTVPQLALGVVKLIALLFEVVPLVPELALVLAAAWVPAQFASELVTATRA